MGLMNVKVDTKNLKAFAEKLGTLNGINRDKFFQDASKEMAARLLALVIPRTPVGKDVKNDEGKTIHEGGTLRRGWTGGRDISVDQIMSFVNDIKVNRVPGGYTITVTNTAPYASYVEHGHRQTPGRYVPAIGKRLKVDWVEGQKMLELSENDLRKIAPRALEKKLNEFLRTVF